MATNHKLIIGNCMVMEEVPTASIHLMVTSPPYFNAPFDYKGLFKGYGQYLEVLRNFAQETFRVYEKVLGGEFSGSAILTAAVGSR